ncbi:hypothetical protein DQ392_01540 [Streptomyces reniochalinae]|uniref:Uncharacterized protein n=1 Tax=Streptomyces reniochalinae TaxID=2250578 RepID=A0A367F6B2_9ACTN|nr:hypothetical protein DQ392_01540 [Streptomyces reniochalinae]
MPSRPRGDRAGGGRRPAPRRGLRRGGAGPAPGEDVGLIMDPASSEFFHDGVYVYAGEGVRRSPSEHAARR